MRFRWLRQESVSSLLEPDEAGSLLVGVLLGLRIVGFRVPFSQYLTRRGLDSLFFNSKNVTIGYIQFGKEAEFLAFT
jgi:hypothetical protein